MPHIHIRSDAQMHDQLTKLADAHGRSLNNEGIQAVRAWIYKHSADLPTEKPKPAARSRKAK